MSTNLFSKAAAYRKRHPGMSMPEAVKAVSKKAPVKKKAAAKKRPAAKKAAPRKKAAVKKKAVGKASGPRKLKVKIRKTKNGGTTLKISGIAGISMSRLDSELRHLQSLQTSLVRYQDAYKAVKDRSAKAKISADIKKMKAAIQTSKRHITALKRSI